MLNRAVVIGVGNIGRRHVQGLLMSGVVDRVCCYDASPEAQQALRDFCAALRLDFSKINWQDDISKVYDELRSEDIVIVSTPADCRFDILKYVISRKPRAVIAEKPVCVSNAHYNELVDMAETSRVPVYVNFVRRSYEVYRRIYEALRGSKQIVCTATMGRAGLICSGIHYMDLAAWLTGGQLPVTAFARSSSTFESKRAGYFDCYGDLLVHFGQQRAFYLNSALDGPCLFEVTTEEHTFKVYEDDGVGTGKLLVFDVKKGGWQQEDIQVPFTSLITAQEVKKVAQGLAVSLPTLKEGVPAHRMMLDYLRMTGLQLLRVT